MPDQKCEQWKEHLQRVHALKQEFDAALGQALAVQNTEKARQLQHRLGQEVSALAEEVLPVLRMAERARKYCKDQYERWGLQELANTMPEKVKLTREQRERIKELAEKEGFDSMMILPKELTKHREAIAEATTKSIHGLPQKQQYNDTEPMWMQVRSNRIFRIRLRHWEETRERT